MIGIHPNTVRLYEEWGFIPKVARSNNGYRIFTDWHISAFKMARKALQIELIQSGLRKKMIAAIQEMAQQNFDEAIALVNEYLAQIKIEKARAQESIEIVESLLTAPLEVNHLQLKRGETASYLGITVDSLRNWELNGLLEVKRTENNYRVYTEEDIKRLKIIRTLRFANYSLEAILRLLATLSSNPNSDIKTVLNSPGSEADIISVCDHLLISLEQAEKNAEEIKDMLVTMKKKFNN